MGLVMKKYIIEITNLNGTNDETFDGCFVVPLEIITSQDFYFFAYSHDDYIKEPYESPIKGSLHFCGIVKEVITYHRDSDIKVITPKGVYYLSHAGVL